MTLAIDTDSITATRTLFAALIDYAGLFPPAALAFDEALATYARERDGADEWMLGSLVLPCERLLEAEAAGAGRAGGADSQSTGGEPWPVSVLVQGRPEEIERLGAEVGQCRALVVGALEVAPLEPERIGRFGREAPADIPVFFEVPLDELLEERLAAVAEAGRCAKVRMGGLSRAAFPAPETVARFLCLCRRYRAPFKATAGLHHVLRGQYPVTYEPSSPRAWMHGLLNLALAAALGFCDEASPDEVAALLAEGDREAFSVERKRIQWRERSWSLDELGRLRRRFFLSVGSCSFREPLSELEELGLLG